MSLVKHLRLGAILSSLVIIATLAGCGGGHAALTRDEREALFNANVEVAHYCLLDATDGAGAVERRLLHDAVGVMVREVQAKPDAIYDPRGRTPHRTVRAAVSSAARDELADCDPASAARLRRALRA